MFPSNFPQRVLSQSSLTRKDWCRITSGVELAVSFKYVIEDGVQRLACFYSQYVLFSARCFRTFWTISVLVLVPPRSGV